MEGCAAVLFHPRVNSSELMQSFESETENSPSVVIFYQKYP